MSIYVPKFVPSEKFELKIHNTSGLWSLMLPPLDQAKEYGYTMSRENLISKTYYTATWYAMEIVKRLHRQANRGDNLSWTWTGPDAFSHHRCATFYRSTSGFAPTRKLMFEVQSLINGMLPTIWADIYRRYKRRELSSNEAVCRSDYISRYLGWNSIW